MPKVNPEVLAWARETAGINPDTAVEKLDLHDARGKRAIERLAELENGAAEPSRPMLAKMAKLYRRSLLTFYMGAPPRTGDRGEDFRTLPEEHPKALEALLDALIRDIRARQSMVRSVLEDDEETKPLRFVGSKKMSDGVPALVDAIKEALGVQLADFRTQSSIEEAFAFLRSRAEAAGIFVLLIGNLGSSHTAIDLETFRGFALADPIAPFVVINDQDARSAWSFTLLHEIAHLLLGTTGVSGESAEMAIERFCNDVAGEFLLPTGDLTNLQVNNNTALEAGIARISEFATGRRISRAMVAYKLLRTNAISVARWRGYSAFFREEWLKERAKRREKGKEAEGGPNYYVVRRHRLGAALLNLVKRTMSDGALTPTKAGKVLGVKPRNVESLLNTRGVVAGPAEGRA